MGQQISSTLAMQDKDKQPAPQQGDQLDSFDEFSGPRRGFMYDAHRAYEHPLVDLCVHPSMGNFQN